MTCHRPHCDPSPAYNADAPTGNFGEFLFTQMAPATCAPTMAGQWDKVYTLDSTDTNLIYLRPGATIGGAARPWCIFPSAMEAVASRRG
jgi:hypothetical protein